MNIKLLSGLLLVISLSCSCRAQCPKVKTGDLPKKDLPPVDFKKNGLAKTTSYSYYYGLGVPQDYKIARYVAFSEMSNTADEGPLAGSAILLMLYANGYGVARNWKLCAQLACGNVGGATAEKDMRIAHLKNMQAGDSAKVFDICDDITSGYMAGFCQSVASERLEYTRSSRRAAVLASWSAADTLAYGKLQVAATNFFNDRVNNEVDMSGTSRAAIAQQESDALDDTLLCQTILCGNCAFPNYSAPDFAKADAELNKVYKKIMAAGSFDMGTITQDGIKETQRAWLRYRDAWATFSRSKCPKLTDYSCKTIITKERILQLSDFTDGE